MKAIFLLFLLVPLVALSTSAPSPHGLTNYSIVSSIIQKILDMFKKAVDKVAAEVEKLLKAIEAGIQKLDPAVIKDLEDIIDTIVGLGNTGVEIASAIIEIIDGAMGGQWKPIAQGIISLVKSGIEIFQEIVTKIIPDVFDILKHLTDKDLAAKLQKQLQDSATTLQSSIDKLQAELDKIQHKTAV